MLWARLVWKQCFAIGGAGAHKQEKQGQGMENWLQKRWLVYAYRPTFLNQPGVPAVIVYKYFPSCSKVLSPCKPIQSKTAKRLIQCKGYFNLLQNFGN